MTDPARPDRPIIRPLSRADETDWRALWRGYLDFYETDLPEEIYRTSFERLLDPAVTDYHGRLALLDGQPVGLVHYIYHRHGWKLEPVCYLQDLFTTSEARGRGVARALIETVYAEADAAQAPSVYWLTQEFNSTARALYDKVATCTPFIVYRRA